MPEPMPDAPPHPLAASPIGQLQPIPEGVLAYVPDPLPRSLQLPPDVVYLLDEASREVATLAGVGETLLNPRLLIAPFLRLEAVLSSRIEGTQASLSDVYVFEAGGREPADAREVWNYVQAVEHGLARLDALPISLRLLLELHELLLTGVRGSSLHPGELRDRQVWLGAAGTPIARARYVPPPPRALIELLADWERFVHDDGPLPPLVRAALMHYQFEAVHPFIDGNGRIGRLLIPLLLAERGVLRTPLLYLSAYFERRRPEYYDQLLAVSHSGDWTPWLRFFLLGVRDQARDALRRARTLRDLHEHYRALLQERRAAASVLQLLDELFVRPVFTRRHAADRLGVTVVATRAIIDRLEAAGIVAPVADTYPQLFRADELLAALG